MKASSSAEFVGPLAFEVTFDFIGEADAALKVRKITARPRAKMNAFLPGLFAECPDERVTELMLRLWEFRCFVILHHLVIYKLNCFWKYQLKFY